MNISRYDSISVILGEYGRRIKTTRIALSITQDELSRKTGLSRRTISNIENGNDFSMDSLIRILQTLKLDRNLNSIVPEYDNERQRYKKKKEVPVVWGDEK